MKPSMLHIVAGGVPEYMSGKLGACFSLQHLISENQADGGLLLERRV